MNSPVSLCYPLLDGFDQVLLPHCHRLVALLARPPQGPPAACQMIGGILRICRPGTSCIHASTETTQKDCIRSVCLSVYIRKINSLSSKKEKKVEYWHYMRVFLLEFLSLRYYIILISVIKLNLEQNEASSAKVHQFSCRNFTSGRIKTMFQTMIISKTNS